MVLFLLLFFIRYIIPNTRFYYHYVNLHSGEISVYILITDPSIQNALISWFKSKNFLDLLKNTCNGSVILAEPDPDPKITIQIESQKYEFVRGSFNKIQIQKLIWIVSLRFTSGQKIINKSNFCKTQIKTLLQILYINNVYSVADP